MLASRLIGYLQGSLPASEFERYIRDEVKGHVDALKRPAATAPVFLTEDACLTLTTEHVLRMIRDFLSASLSAEQVEYICDAIELSDSFVFGDDEELQDVVFELGNKSINGALTPAQAIAISSRLT